MNTQILEYAWSVVTTTMESFPATRAGLYASEVWMEEVADVVTAACRRYRGPGRPLDEPLESMYWAADAWLQNLDHALWMTEEEI
jgi:hypothetical protein